MRADGLAAVLGRLLNDRRVLGAVLVDVDSGMVLDTCSARADPDERGLAGGIGGVDPEVVGAGHAELSRVALALPGRAGPETAGDELVVSLGPARHHLLRAVPDPHGDRLVLAVVVQGSRRFAERVRRRLRGVPADALTAGPTVVRRPGTGGWAAAPVASAGARPGARGPAGTPAVGVRPDGPPRRVPAPTAAIRAPGGLFEPPPSGPVAPGGPGGPGGGGHALPAPPMPAAPAVFGRFPGHPVGPAPAGPGTAAPAPVPAGAAVPVGPAAPATHHTPGATAPAPSLFTPGADLGAAAPTGPRAAGGAPPAWRDSRDHRDDHRDDRGNSAATRPRAGDGPADGGPRPPAPPSALPPGRPA